MKIKELLRSHPNGVDITLFGELFARRFDRKINFENYGHSSLKQLLQNCSDIVNLVTVEKNGKKLTMLFLRNPRRMSPVLNKNEVEIKQKDIDASKRNSSPFNSTASKIMSIFLSKMSIFMIMIIRRKRNTEDVAFQSDSSDSDISSFRH